MPEGDTVWRTAVHLDRALGGEVLQSTEFRVPQLATADLAGERCDAVVSRGKFVLMRIGGHTVVSHLRMEGAWHLYRMPRPRWRRPAHTARAVLATRAWQAVGFDLGLLRLVPRDAEGEVVGHLGPDVLAPEFDAALAVANLSARPDRPVFTALLDQRNLAGLGNEYVNEVLYVCGLAPTLPVGDAPDPAAVVDTARRLITANARGVERNFTGDPRPGRERWVYARAGRPCRRCGAVIRTGQLGDDPTRERVTFWCPVCQPG